MTVNPDDNRGPVALRVRRLRAAADYPTARSFAAAIGITEQRLNNVENGKPLSIELALKIKRAMPGITLDWLYDGDAGGLTMQWAQRLLPKKPHTSETLRSLTSACSPWRDQPAVPLSLIS